MSGFKKQKTQPLQSNGGGVSEFENGGRAQDTESKHKKETKDKGVKMFSAPIPVEVIERLKRYQNSEHAKKIETQAYILTQALNAWLDSKGFEK